MNPIETLTTEQLQYHREVIKSVNNALAIKSHWFAYLANQWSLQPGDLINEEGLVIRQDKLEQQYTPQSLQ